MSLRRRVFLSSSAVLFLGPMFAGLAGWGLEVAWPFAGLFLLWLERVRPGDWPRSAGEWLRPVRLGWLALIAFGQGLLVCFLIVVGAGMRGLAGDLPEVPLPEALAISAGAVGLAWLLRTSPLVEADGAPCLGSGVLWPAPPAALTVSPDALSVAREMLAALPAGGAARDQIAPVLDHARHHGIEIELLSTLLRFGGAHLPNIQTAVALALRPDPARRIVGRGMIRQAAAAALASRSPTLIRETVDGLDRLVLEHPEVEGELQHLAALSRDRTAPQAWHAQMPAPEARMA